MDQITAAAQRITGRYRAAFSGADIVIERYNTYPGLSVAPEAPVVGLAQRLTGGLAMGADTTKVAFGTEAGVFAALGVPTIVCGPGSMAGQGHKADEYITESQLAACDLMMDRIVDDISR